MFSPKLILFLITFFVLACLTIPVSAGENMDSISGFLCEYAKELYRQGNINDAIYQLKNALALNPEDPTARRYLEKILSEPPAPPPKAKNKKLKQVTPAADTRKKQLNSWLDREQQDRVQRDKTQQDSAANELRQSLQDKEGQIKSLSNQLVKTQQEKDALLNKDNEQSKLMQEVQAQKKAIAGQKEELGRLVQDKEDQLKQLSSQLASLKAELAGKDAKLKKLEDNLQTEKGDFVAKQQEMSLSVLDKQKQLEQLNRQMIQMEEERRAYQEQLRSLKASVSEKENDRQELDQEFRSLKKQYAAELERKDADLKQARLDYENRLLSVGGELKAKELMIQQLRDDKAAMLEQGQKAKQLQIARVEKLMKEIEDIYPDKQELKNQKAEVSQDDIAAKNRQLDRIDKLMQEIEEILPKSELSP